VASAAVPAGRRPRTLIGLVAAHAPAFRSAGRRLAAAARGHAVSVAAFAAVDYGAFGIGAAHHAAGWIVTGLSAMVLDFLIRGE
jgi:hypothetical protein